MSKHTMTYNTHDIVVVPFPFTDKTALVLSDAKHFNAPVGQSVLAVITSAKNSS